MKPQLLVLPLAVLFLLLFLVVGLFRMFAVQGLMSSPPLVSMFAYHGQMLVVETLAILLVTERYIGALPFNLNRSIHSMPVLVALGAVLKLAGGLGSQRALDIAGTVLLALGFILYLYVLYAVGRRSAQPLPMRFMMVGGVVMLVGLILSEWQSVVGNLPFILFLLGFPMLTILGERVELSRFLSPRAQGWMKRGFWAATLAFLLLLFQMVWGFPLFQLLWALLLTLTVMPLVRGELKLVRMAGGGLHLYLGRHLILAYAWLLLGLLLVTANSLVQDSRALLDASIHALAVGFIGTMILAHTPVIAPVILNRTVAADKLSLLPVALLTVGNGMRVFGYLLKELGAPLEIVVAGSGFLILAAVAAFAWMLVRSLRPA
jgi:nitrite reductase (NO-forming)